MYLLLVFGTICLLIIPFFKYNLKFYMFFVAAFFSFFGFLYDPIAQLDAVKIGSGVDLVRYFDELARFRFYGDSYNGYLSQPLSRYYLMFFSNFDNDHLLPGVTTFLIYIINLTILYKIGKKNKFSDSIIAIGMITFIAFNDYFSTINTIRYPMAMTLFFLVLYWDLFCNIQFVKIFYIIPILFHPGITVLLLSRVISQGRLKYSIIFGIGFVAILISGFYEIFDYLINFTDSLFGTSIFASGLQTKTLSYTDGVVYQVPMLTLMVASFITLILPFFTFIVMRINEEWVIKNRKFITMECFLVIMSIFFLVTNISTGNMTTRISTAVSFFAGVLIMPIEYSFIRYYNEQINYRIFNLFFLGYIGILIVLRFGKQYVSWIAPGL
jgi:hypothetical protein